MVKGTAHASVCAFAGWLFGVLEVQGAAFYVASAISHRMHWEQCQGGSGSPGRWHIVGCFQPVVVVQEGPWVLLVHWGVHLLTPVLSVPAGKPHVPDLPGGCVGGAAGCGLRQAGAEPHNSLEDEDAGPGVGAAARC